VLIERSMHADWLSNAYLIGDVPGGTAVFVVVGVPVVPGGVGGIGVGVEVGEGVGVGGTPQLIVYCVPPRAMSRLAFAPLVKV